ncbi:YlmC/YmxH family sporulation protein [Clostridiisalibacter paucivorans]|uniref:YlmC/YmxH family sporulation protein n=1 Tax=Clostridiisalibacter paucivorans TaxID=408753 RepID=UPI00047BABEC|nr:YlmC/YmxH family sporulation protein [Clostridiisalibacter paucivorans]
MIKASDLREKEVINIKDGARLGVIYDIEVDLEEGYVNAVIIPGPNRFLGLFNRNGDYIVRWDSIKKIGHDVILVDLKEE